MKKKAICFVDDDLGELKRFREIARGAGRGECAPRNVSDAKQP